MQEYYSAENMRDVFGAVLNYQAVLRQLWPHDWTADIMLRVLFEWDFLSLVVLVKSRITVFSEFFNSVLYSNATNLDRGPMSYEEMVKLWKAVLSKHGVPGTKPHVFR